MQKPILGSIYSPTEAMELAIAVAYQGANRVSPNPHVGCVVLDKSYKLLSWGYHQHFGGPHAEVNALKHLESSDLEGAHVFVTLEPCSHIGKTAACADFLANLPIESLTYGTQDPNDLVAGKGLEVLRQRGIQVKAFEKQQEEIQDLLLSFKHHLKHKEAFVALKVATTLEGAIADKNHQSQWITSEEARNYVHFLRSRYHAMLVGKSTINYDDPSLNVRHEDFLEHTNKVIVMNPSLDLLSSIKEKKIYKSRKPQDIILVTSDKNTSGLEHMQDEIYRDNASGVLVIAIQQGASGLDLKQLKSVLPRLQIYDVMVEGGATTYSSFLEQGAFDHIYLFQAPIILGAEKSKFWTSHVSKTLDQKIQLRRLSLKCLGPDVLFQLTKN